MRYYVVTKCASFLSLSLSEAFTLSLSLFRSQTLPFNEISLSLSFSRAWPKHARFFLFLSRVCVCTSHARAIGRIS